MVVMLAGHVLLPARVTVAVLIDISGGVARVVVMLAGRVLLPVRVAVAVLIDIAGRMARMVMMHAWFLFRHLLSPDELRSGWNARRSC
jgi:hypothetical protein